MALNISTNTAAHRAGAQLSFNQTRLQRSFDRIASGKRISTPVEDPGSLDVSMKLEALINRISGVQINVKNGTSFLEVQDGFLNSAGQIIDRMSEFKGLSSQDPMKGQQDRACYHNEFKDLQAQLYNISKMKFNVVSLFAEYSDRGGQAVLAGSIQGSTLDNTLTIYTSASGASGSKVSVYKSTLLSALTFDTNLTGDSQISSGYTSSENSDNTKNIGTEPGVFKVSFAVNSDGNNQNFLDRGDISVGVIAPALENIVFLMSQNGGSSSRLTFNSESLVSPKPNMRASLGRMVDVDMAEETTNLAKHSFLFQATSSILSQANSNTDIALMRLR